MNNHCSIENCKNKYLAKGYCSTHYKQYVYLVRHPLYHVWQSMVARCYKPYSSAYKDYGGRGIKICRRWFSFKRFEEDMTPGYKPGLSIDRINNDGDYEPNNCRWATPLEQRHNQRKQKLRYDSPLGHAGIRQVKNKYYARGTNGKHLGVYPTLELAIEGRQQWYKTNIGDE